MAGALVWIINLVNKMNKRNRYALFIIGLITFYFAQLISPNKLIYFSSYFFAAYLFYQSFKNIDTALTLVLILSLFSEVSLGAGLFLMQPESYQLGSGFWISPTTIITFLILIGSFRKKIKMIHPVDIFLFALYCWVLVSTLFNLDQKSLLGFIRFSQTSLVYLLFRMYLNKINLKFIAVLLLSMLIFQSSIAILQVIQGKPLGLLAEVANLQYPQGYLTTEEETGFLRVTGTFGHPNITASVLLALSPFVYAWPLPMKSQSSTIMLLYATYIAIFFTYSRVATITFIAIHLFLVRAGNIIDWVLSRRIWYMRLILIVSVLVLLVATLPNTVTRVLSFPRSLEATGSFGFRIKLAREAVAVMNRFPFFGVGLERSLPYIIDEPATDVFKNIPPSNFYKIHSLFLELGSEVGITGILLLGAAIIATLRHVGKNSSGNFLLLSKAALTGVIIISTINPFLHTSQVTLIVFFIALILAQ